MPFLRYEDSSGVHFVDLSLRSSVVIGRDKTCDVPIPDTNASRKHCEVHSLGGGCVVKDLHSKNGTCVNGAPISSWTLKDGDLINVGGTTFRYILNK